MRLPLLCAILLIGSGAARAQPSETDVLPDSGDSIAAVQKRPLRQARRLEILSYGEMSIADPYLQRWGGGLRAMWHLREGFSLGLDAGGLGSWQTQELTIAKRELHARILDSRQLAALMAIASLAPLYGKVALPGDALVHFETFIDAGLGGVYTATDATRGVRPAVTAGLGQRIFLGENVALTARVGGNFYAERLIVDGRPQGKVMGFWSVRLGLSLYFGSGR
jgi:outer membrane beta-barrel protein